MNPLADRISTVERELLNLQDQARRLTRAVREIKTEVRPEIPTKPALRATPPPLPEPVTEPTRAPEPEPVLLIPEAPIAPEEGLEMHLGRVWSVRLGIVLLTTGFVFLSRYTYDSIIRDLGPGVRLALMTIFSFLLTTAGLVCERWKDSLKSYGRIVAAGGLAAIYYCSFAAHNVEPLKVIESPVVASILMTASAGLFCSVSLWRKSRVMLSTSLALAFYSISINPIGWMACLSAAILAGFGIFMMIRHRWAEVGFLVLAGSYLSYLWWQIIIGDFGSSATSPHWFLPAYWLIFTVGAWVPQERLDARAHTLFTSLNNSAFFFLLSAYEGLGQWMTHQWLFCLIFGAVLVTIAILSKTSYPEQSRLVHLAKGLGLITLGLALKLEGPHLFTAFLIEALILMALNLRFEQPLTKVAAWISATLSFLALGQINLESAPTSLYLGGALAWLALGTLHRQVERSEASPLWHAPAALASALSLALFIFGFLGLDGSLKTPLIVASLGLAGSLTQALPSARRYFFDFLALLSAAGLIAVISLFEHSGVTVAAAVYVSLLALVGSLAAFVTYTKLTTDGHKEAFHGLVGLTLSLGLGHLAQALELSQLGEPLKVLIYLTIPIAGTLIHRRTDLLAHLIVPALMYLGLLRLEIWASSTVLLVFVLSTTHFLIGQRQESPTVRLLSQFLIIISAASWAVWLMRIFPHPGIPLTLTSLALFGIQRFWDKRLSLIFGSLFFVLALSQSLLSVIGSAVHLPLYFTATSMLALHLYRSRSDQEPALRPHAVIALLLFWAILSLDFWDHPRPAIWTLLGTSVLLLGLACRSRCLRITSLIILAASIGHLMLIDLLQLEPLPRILSFITLGFALLGLGFVYNRWQDRLKQIL